tara:strand:+ start:245 stop:511 length:267 start_codon:yes stop_codon:yes gene_type:complete
MVLCLIIIKNHIKILCGNLKEIILGKKMYYTMNDVPIGTEMIIKKTNQKGVLKEIIQFPTTFKLIIENDKLQNCLTHEVEIIGWPPND